MPVPDFIINSYQAEPLNTSPYKITELSDIMAAEIEPKIIPT